MIRKFIRQYKNNEPLTIVGNGEQRRDFTHIDDITDGLICIMNKGKEKELYHLGRGVNYSINELSSMFPNASIKYVPLRKGEGKVTLADYESTFKKLNWSAKINLEEYLNSYL